MIMIQNIANKGWCLLLCVLMTLGGCTKSEDVVETTLKLSQPKILLPKEKNEAVVEVTTNAPEWTAFAESSWIEVSRDGHKLVVHAAANEGVKARTGIVKVLAGSLVQALSVEQTAADVVLSPMTETQELDQWGGEISIYVDANTADWEATTDVDWITLDPHNIRNTLIVSVDENITEEAREGTISFVHAGTVLSTCVVKQSAKLTFLMPAPKFMVKINEVRSFEGKRRSDIVKIPDGFVNSTLWGFRTKSELFPTIEYEFIGERYMSAKVIAKDKKTFTENVEGLKEFLLSNGFVEGEVKDTYMNDELEMSAKINTTFRRVDFVFEPHQPEPYPTFSELPLGPESFCIGDEELIAEFERKMGGTLNEERSRKNYLFYNATAPWLHRAYELQAKTGQMVMSIPNIHQAVFMVGDHSFVTKEFKELMAKEGFVYDEYVHTYKMHSYRNSARRMRINVFPMKSTVDDQDPVLFLNVIKTKKAN